MGLTSCKAGETGLWREPTWHSQEPGQGPREPGAQGLGRHLGSGRAGHSLRQLPRRLEPKKPRREDASSLWELRLHSWRKVALRFRFGPSPSLYQRNEWVKGGGKVKAGPRVSVALLHFRTHWVACPALGQLGRDEGPEGHPSGTGNVWPFETKVAPPG